MKPDKADIIRIIYIGTFFSIFIAFKELSFLSGFNKMLVSGLLGAIGGGIGALIYQLVSKKKDSLKYIIIGIVLLVFFSSIITLKKINQNNQIKNPLDTYLTNLLIKEASKPLDTNSLKPPKLTADEYKRLITCELCGYKAVCPDSTNKYCYNCYNSVYDTSLYSAKNRAEWFRNDQLRWFCPDTSTSKVEFYEPKIQNGFVKDSKWRPLVTEKEVWEYYWR